MKTDQSKTKAELIRELQSLHKRISAQDVTKQVRAEEDMKKNEQFLNSILESVQDGISVLKPDLTVHHVNRIMNKWYKDNLPLEGKKCYEVYHNADKPCDPCPTLRCLESGKAEGNVVPGLPGSPVEWIELFSYPIKDPNSDKVTGVVEFVRDITKQKKEEKLQSVLYRISRAVSTTNNLDELYQAIHNQLTNVIDTTNFFIALIDADKNVMSFPYFVDEFDDPPDPIELTKKTISEYVIKTKMSLYFKAKDIRELADMGMIDLDYAGTISKVWLGAPLQVKNKSIGVIVVQSYHDPDIYSESDLDILSFVSEQVAIAIARKQANELTRESEKKYRLLSEQLTEANILKEILLDIITHDLKNPIGVISGMAEIMLEEKSDIGYIKIVKSSSDALLKTMDNATTIAKVALGDKIKLEEIDITEILYSVGKELSSQVKQSDMTLIIDVPNKLIIKANPIISEVFSNYISNAIKYARKGKQIIVDSEKHGGFLTINVKDFGTTIPEEHRQKVFDRTHQIDDKKRGRGLGLSIVDRIADAHNAEVGVKPNEPVGNIFYIKIPNK